MEHVTKIVITASIIVITLIFQKVFQKAIDRYARKYNISHKRMLALHKTKSITLYFIAAIAVILTWGFSLENIWVSVAGFVGLIAIGFFAVWSILSNIFAGLMLYFAQTIRIQEKIEIVPEGISGTVTDINLFFIILTDDQENQISIPNNLIFQKMVKKLRT
jgi:small-conductance mechanosensitive channel